MEIRCENTYSKQFGLLTGCIVTEPDGTRREICPLFYGQMIRRCKYTGQFFYVKDMPTDYFEKAKTLEANGWSTWYHYDNWINDTVKNPERDGYCTDDALKKCLTTATTLHKGDKMRVTNEQALEIRDGFFQSIIVISRGYDKDGNENIITARDVSADLLESRAQNAELLAALKNLYNAYVNVLENGRDRILFLGGKCDSIKEMQRTDHHLIDARAAIAKMEVGKPIRIKEPS